METKIRGELDGISLELNSIICELENIRDGIKNDFIGIGKDICANRLTEALDSYYQVYRSLNNINITRSNEGLVLAGKF